MSTCASDGPTGFGLGETAEQAVQTHPNDDEERLEQMVHPKNQEYVGRSSKGGMDLLGSVWNGYGKVLLVVEEKGVLGPQCSPKHNAFDSSLSLCGCDRTTSISSLRASYGNESAQTEDLAQATIQEVLHRSRCFAHRSSRARGFIRGWIQTAWRIDALPKKVTKEANQQSW